MTRTEKFTTDQLRQIAEVLVGDGNLVTILIHYQRWKKTQSFTNNMNRDNVLGTLHYVQEKFGKRDAVLGCIKSALEPVLFANDPNRFDEVRKQLNSVLAFAGLTYNEDGTFAEIEPASTPDEANAIASNIPVNFRRREYHPNVLSCLEVRDLERNIFQVVFEAIKGLTHRIRCASGFDSDGLKLVGDAFGGDDPAIIIRLEGKKLNKNEQVGFQLILKGLYTAVRNQMAHELAEVWGNEDLAADYLSMISLLHRKLDTANYQHRKA